MSHDGGLIPTDKESVALTEMSTSLINSEKKPQHWQPSAEPKHNNRNELIGWMKRMWMEQKNPRITASQNRQANIFCKLAEAKPCVSVGRTESLRFRDMKRPVTRGRLVSWCISYPTKLCCFRNKKKIELISKQMSGTIERFMSQITHSDWKLMKRSRTSSCSYCSNSPRTTVTAALHPNNRPRPRSRFWSWLSLSPSKSWACLGLGLGARCGRDNAVRSTTCDNHNVIGLTSSTSKAKSEGFPLTSVVIIFHLWVQVISS